MSDLLALDDCPNNKIVWAWVATDEEQWLWALAEKKGSDWVGVNAWNAAPEYNSFDDYGWTVLGWKELEQPDSPGIYE